MIPNYFGGSFTGHLTTLSIHRDIKIVPNDKTSDHQPDFIVMAGEVEVGAGWNKIGRESGKPYISVSLAAPEFGDCTLYANLGRAAGSSNDDEYALIWNPRR